MWVSSSGSSSATRGAFCLADRLGVRLGGSCPLVSRSLPPHSLYSFVFSNLCGVGGVLDGLFALCGAGAWGYAAGVLQTAVDSNGNLRSEYESRGEVNTTNEALQQALNELSANSSLPSGAELTNDYDSVLDQRRAAGDHDLDRVWVRFLIVSFSQMMFSSARATSLVDFARSAVCSVPYC